MDHSIEMYQTCIKQLLSEYQSLKNDWSEVELLFDDERMRYMAIRVGWVKHKRIHLCLVHIDICDGNIVIQANNTENPLDDELIAMGIPDENILPGLLPPEVQERAVQQRRERRHTLKISSQQIQERFSHLSSQLA